MATTAVHAAHILVKTEQDANAILDLIRDRVNFGALAKQYSSCPSRAQGGDLGWFKRGKMVPEFDRACFNAYPGDILKVKTQFGWHVIKIIETK